MVQPSIMTKVLENYPSIGDRISRIEGTCVIYESGAILKLIPPEDIKGLSVGDQIKFISYFYDDSLRRIIIHISHTGYTTIQSDPEKLILKSTRLLKLERIFGK